MILFFTILCALSVLVLLYAEAQQKRGLLLGSKTTASIAFVLVAFYAGALDSALGQWILAGLIASLVGDILLTRRNNISFLLGMGAFALAHGAYIGAFLISDTPSFMAIIIGVIILIPIIGLTLKWLWPDLAEFQLPVAGYTMIIGAMVLCAVSGVFSGALKIGFAAGAVMFAVSDISVAMDRFKGEALRNRLWGLPLYFAAQLVLAHQL